MDQWTNEPVDKWSNGPMDQLTSGPMDQCTLGKLKKSAKSGQLWNVISPHIFSSKVSEILTEAVWTPQEKKK